VAGPILTSALGARTARALRNSILAGFVLIPLGWLVWGAAPGLPLALLGVTLRGMGGSINWTYSDVLLQLTAPDQFRGRVFALDFGIFTLMLSASIWLTGTVLDRFTLDPRMFNILLAVLGLLPLAVWLASTRGMGWERAPAS
jgi:hypothetical protein